MANKVFADRLNQALDEIGAPTAIMERVEIFAKLLHVPRFKAEAILNGQMPLDPSLLKTIAEELEVSESWLRGEDD